MLPQNPFVAYRRAYQKSRPPLVLVGPVDELIRLEKKSP